MKDNNTLNNKNLNSINNNVKVRDSWEYSGISSEGDLLRGFHPWPPRSYTCTFCKREFRSAQALGGHMNVHRRDRARLRQSPPKNGHDYPFLNPNPNLNSNPNPNPSQNPNHDYPQMVSPSSLSALSSPSSASPVGIKKWVVFHKKGGGDMGKIKAGKTLVGVSEFEGLYRDSRFEVVKKAGNIVQLDLEIGLVADSKEDLDLELRLGRS